VTPTNSSALDPPATTARSVSKPIADLLAEPTFEECVEHNSRYFDDLNANRIDLRGITQGHYIAYYEGLIRDHDADATALLNRVAARLRVHPARVFVHYPWM
jgi:hypothetical protein